MAHGSGLDTAPRSERTAAARAPPAAPPACASAMHSELVTNMSIRMVAIIGPTTAGPNRAANSGTPMKPVFGNAATSAPNEASFRPTTSSSEKAIVTSTISSAHTR